jgi:multicomponent K+:H+ antiporter subunit G
MNPVVEAILSLLLLVSVFFTLVGSLGLVKLSDFFRRLHGPTKATTMGVGCILIVSVFYHAAIGNSFHPRELLISVLLIVTAPISANLMAKAALSLKLKKRPQCPADETPDPEHLDSPADRRPDEL